jgi:P2 family phage contractile tail tube protein
MVQGSRICRNFTLSVNLQDLTGKAKSVMRPNVSNEVESYRPAGFSAPVPVKTGLKAIEMEFTLFDINPDILSLTGLNQGQNVRFILREVVQSEDGSEHTWYHTGAGMVTEEDKGTAENGAGLGEYKFKLQLRQYKEMFDGRVLKDIDIPNLKEVIGGLDQAVNYRRILGIGTSL